MQITQHTQWMPRHTKLLIPSSIKSHHRHVIWHNHVKTCHQQSFRVSNLIVIHVYHEPKVDLTTYAIQILRFDNYSLLSTCHLTNRAPNK